MRALVIEDEPVIAINILVSLQEVGFTDVEIAASEDEALQKARAAPPLLLIADYQLAQGDGLSAVRRILDGGAGPRPNVIFVTGHSQLVRREWQNAVSKLGAAAPARWLIVDKPFDATALSKLAREMAGRPH